MAKEIEVVEEYDGRGGHRTVSRTVKNTAKAGISFGSCLAIVISYTKWHSILWAIFHGLLSWAYVIYYIIRY
ncbi:MAG TPA: hypothetical protein DEB10_14315 [Ruminococcaceae bacterium]|jgi:hypothetical protein|nr:hypothetical protein [Oscillospiraceae bacterium]HCA31055.1 hypothetical protein [Oscillospiraceae bacterium]